MASAKRLPRSYYRLVEEFPLKAIESDEALAQAHAVLERVFHTEGDEGVDAYVEVLSGLVDDYERTAYPSSAEPWEILAHLIDARGLTAEAVTKQVKVSRAALARILDEKQPASLAVAAKLAPFFGVPLELFLARKAAPLPTE